MKLYLGLAGPLLLYVYLPVVLIGLSVLLFKIKSRRTRAWTVPLYLFLAYTIPLGDVTWHSWNMAKVCPKAGLHIYRTVVVDGFLGGYAGRDILERYPYSYIEQEPLQKHFIRFEHSGDQIIEIKISHPTSEWEIVRDPFDYPDTSLGVTVDRHAIRSRYTGEVLAESFSYMAWRGWIDAWISSVIDNSAGVCYRPPTMTQKYREILIPSGAVK